jgi:hypothetical protein
MLDQKIFDWVSFSPGKQMVNKVNWVNFQSDLESTYTDKMGILSSIADLENAASEFSQFN